MAESPALAGLIDIDTTFLPIGQMRQISRVTVCDGPRLGAEVDLGCAHWVWDQHFPNDPIFPGALIVEAAGQAIALWAWADGQRGRPRLVRIEAEFLAPVTPDDPRLIIDVMVNKRRHLNFADVSLRASKGVVARVKAVLVVLAP